MHSHRHTHVGKLFFIIFKLTPGRHHVILVDGAAYVTLGVAMAQMQLVTLPIAHSYRCTELWLYNYVRLHALLQ